MGKVWISVRWIKPTNDLPKKKKTSTEVYLLRISDNKNNNSSQWVSAIFDHVTVFSCSIYFLPINRTYKGLNNKIKRVFCWIRPVNLIDIGHHKVMLLFSKPSSNRLLQIFQMPFDGTNISLHLAKPNVNSMLIKSFQEWLFVID